MGLLGPDKAEVASRQPNEAAAVVGLRVAALCVELVCGRSAGAFCATALALRCLVRGRFRFGKCFFGARRVSVLGSVFVLARVFVLLSRENYFAEPRKKIG